MVEGVAVVGEDLDVSFFGGFVVGALAAEGVDGVGGGLDAPGGFVLEGREEGTDSDGYFYGGLGSFDFH